MAEVTQAEDITRPIIGIENRTAQEVFDIMCDRIRSAARHRTEAVKPLVEALAANQVLLERIDHHNSTNFDEVRQQILANRAALGSMQS